MKNKVGIREKIFYFCKRVMQGTDELLISSLNNKKWVT